jgi:oligopeptide/dipeptide ABC transporter ATP-binding protein
MVDLDHSGHRDPGDWRRLRLDRGFVRHPETTVTQPLLAVDRVHARIGNTEVLAGVSLELHAGESIGLVGETGSGKTMTVRTVTGTLRHIGGRVTRGSVRLDGQDLTHATGRRWRRLQGRTVAMVPQASMSSLDPLQRIRHQLGEAIVVADRQADVVRETARLVESVRLEPTRELLESRPHELSGGMRQRVMIALALAARPRILIADEPTTALDAAVRKGILKLLTELRREQNLALLMVSHDITAITAATHSMIVMYAGRSVEAGPTAGLVARPRHPYTVALLSARPERTPPGHRLPVISGQPPLPGKIGPGCPFAPRCSFARTVCDSQRPQVTTLASGWTVECLREQPDFMTEFTKEAVGS